MLARLLQVCTPGQERVLRLSFGIGCAPMPTMQIAASLDLTRHQTRNLRDNALIRMRIEVQLLDDPAVRWSLVGKCTGQGGGGSAMPRIVTCGT